MAVKPMGKLSSVHVRELWDHEAHDFTPWLAENLSHLSEVLDVDLDLERTEMAITGGYRADIVCSRSADGARVLIENQLEWANIHHLGQVMAYLSGLDAKMVVWIARGFADAHLSAIRWLNEHTAEDFDFFAVGVSAIKIDESNPAPVFEVIERPNNWDGIVRGEVEGLSELGQWRRDFWEHLRQRHPETPVLRPGYAGSNVNHRIKELNLRLSWWLGKGSNAGAFLARIDKAYGEPVRETLDPYRDELLDALREAQARDGFSEGVDVIVDPDKTCSIRLYVDPFDRNNWDKIADWLESRRQIYKQVLTGPPADAATATTGRAH